MTRYMPRNFRIAKVLVKDQQRAIKCRNILAITLKIGDVILPIAVPRHKQGRGNTDKPTCFRTLIKEVLDDFDAEGVDLRKYPIPFDSWYGKRPPY